jgi:hypothetical protein
MVLNRSMRIIVAVAALIFAVSCSRKNVSAVRESSPRSAAVQLIDIANDQSDKDNLDDGEPSIAVNPKNPKEVSVVAFSGAWDATTMAPIWKSDDVGEHWRRVPQLPQPSRLDGPGDQAISYDTDGRLVVVELGLADDSGESDVPPRNFIYRQEKGADEPLEAGEFFGDDQPQVIVDLHDTNCRNRVYSAWLNTRPSQGTSDAVLKELSMDSSSPDGGKTLQDARVGDNRKFPNRTTRVTVDHHGHAYVVYKTREGAVGNDFERAHFRVKRSDDCGKTWANLGDEGVSVTGSSSVLTLFTDNFGNPAKGATARARSSDAWITTSPTSDDVYVAYVNKENSGFAQIYVARSADLGKTWTTNRATDGSHNSGYPEVAVTSDDAVGLLYVDYDDSGTQTVFRHRMFISLDHGKTWTGKTLQDLRPNDLQLSPSGFLWGDYEGLVANGTTFFGAFTGESINRAVKQLDPIFFKVASHDLSK